MTYIGPNAFQNCSSLESINIPKNVTFIGQYAFDGCVLLESIVLYENVSSVGNYAFRNCHSLASFTGLSSKGYGGSYVFSYCEKLKDIQLGSVGNGVTTIGSYFLRNTYPEEKMVITVYVNDPETQIANQPWGASNSTISYMKA